MLPDHAIRQAIDLGRVSIHPPPEDHQIQPASVDLRLDRKFLIPEVDEDYACSLRKPPTFSVKEVSEGGPIRIGPGEFLLASTIERITLSPRMAARVEGRSSLGRLGLAVHITAGFIDPGFSGNITLEIANLAPWPVVLRAGERVAQICLYDLGFDVDRPYGHPELRSKYVGEAARGVVVSRNEREP